MWKNAVLSIRKNVGRTILLLGVAFLIINLVMAGLEIRTATEKSMDATRESLGSDVTLAYNMKALMSNRSKGEALDQFNISIKVSDANELSKLKYVTSVNYLQSVSVDTDDIEPVNMSSTTTTSQSEQLENNQDNKKLGPMDNNNFTVSGQSTMKTLSAFVNKQYVLKSGRLLSESDAHTNNVVISSELASDNNLKVGSTFSVYTSDSSNNKIMITVNVVGIYRVKTVNQIGGMSNRQSPYNTIYSSLETAQKLNGSTTTISSAIYTLDDSSHISAFEKLAKKTSLDWDTYTLDANDQVYQMSIGSLKNMNKFASLFVMIVIVGGGIVMALVLMLTLRSRYHEYGILLSLGESKLRIVGQQLIEVGLVVAFAFMLSLGSGQFVGKKISNMLASASSNTPAVTMKMPTNKNNNGQQPQQKTKDLDVSLSGEVIGEVTGVSVLIVVIAILLPSLAILRMSPRKILMKKEG
ncbi:ABC transporter permease [Sharpea azabuensis]|uniref:ABC transporter permease n=1 Tax=Sharpea azabuensis TaxID=322505 RepID=UPI002409D207|nr:ABC transporter permease [Sharpea azabuensis]MDD6513611.1 ABC transporter permease [Sharpea azabuensis]